MEREQADQASSKCARAVDAGPWLARRLVAWLPPAYGRRLIPQHTFPEEHSEGGRAGRTVDDPIFVTAVARAARATREEMQAIGLRSAEVNAIHAGLRDGAEVGDAFAAFVDAHGYPTLHRHPRAVFGSGLGCTATRTAVSCSMQP